MENQAKSTEALRQYAETQLEVHEQELATRYYDRKLSSEELEAEALTAQREIFKEELTDKIAELSQGSDQSPRASLDAVKDEFVKKLVSPKPAF